jgi:multiple sugar transport system ATP-binding protein
VAGFIGSPAMNFIPGKLGAGNEFVADGGFAVPLASRPSGYDGKTLTLGIRPEHFHPATDGFPVEVIVVEPTGSETLLSVRAGTQDLLCVFRERVLPKPGETIHIKPEANVMHLFDQTTGQRIHLDQRLAPR